MIFGADQIPLRSGDAVIHLLLGGGGFLLGKLWHQQRCLCFCRGSRSRRFRRGLRRSHPRAGWLPRNH